MSGSEEKGDSSKAKCLLVDRKFKPEELRIPRNQAYVRDLGVAFKIWQKWGYDIIWVESGMDAMKALRQYPDEINCILLEAYISGGGKTVARLIRFKPDCRHIPVFMMSSQLTPEDLDEGKRIGIFDCFARPFKDLDMLESRMAKAMEDYGGGQR